MVKTTEKLGLLEQVNQSGFVHIPFNESAADRDCLNEFGIIIQTTQIRENPGSTRLLASNEAMDFHTDHFAARYIAWFCNSQSAFGGESLLIDSFSIIKTYSESLLFHLTQISVQSHKVFYNDKPLLPLLQLDETDNPSSVYFAPWLVNPVYDHKTLMALERFKADVQTTKPFEIKLNEGDMLVIDNHRMLHARNGFPAGAGRWLTRYWLS